MPHHRALALIDVIPHRSDGYSGAAASGAGSGSKSYRHLLRPDLWRRHQAHVGRGALRGDRGRQQMAGWV